MIQRFALEYLREWKNRLHRKPLVIRGARQVGKSYLVRELFGAIEFSNFIEINFEKNPEVADIFALKDPERILSYLEARNGVRIEDGKSLLFLDEIQGKPEVFASLRYFYEERPGLHLIAAGSLLEFALAEHEFSMPVGRIEYMYMEPLSFEEFLVAMKKEGLLSLIRSYNVGDDFPRSIHQELMGLVAEFWCVGGLPEAVEAYSQSRSFLEVERIQQSLIATYLDDFSKYRRRVSLESLQRVFLSVPRQIGGKFVYSAVSREIRSSELSRAVALLSQALVLNRVNLSSGNGLPLGAEEKASDFKSYCLDIGLCARQLGLSIASLPLPIDADFMANRGGFCEQYVAEMLKCAMPLYEEHKLYHWRREKSSSNAEVDFLVQVDDEVIPVEVKAGTSGTMKSLHRFLIEKRKDFGLRFNGDMPSFISTKYMDEKGTEYPFRLLSLPFYMIGQYARLVREAKKA